MSNSNSSFRCSPLRLRPWPRVAAVALFTLVAGCKAKESAPPAPPPSAIKIPDGKGAKPTADSPTGVAPGPLDRPPYPAMATAAYGEAVLKSLAASAPAPVEGVNSRQLGFAKLDGAADGSEVEARTLLAAAYKATDDETQKAHAAAGLIFSLVLDTDPVGYLARLTDAYGIHMFLSVPKRGGRLVDAARTLVMAASGRMNEAQPSAERLAEGDPKEIWPRLAEGIAWGMAGEHGKSMEGLNAAAAIEGAPARVFLERGKVLLALGEVEAAAKDAAVAIKASPDCSRCKLLEAQALAFGTKPAEGVTRLDTLAASNVPEVVKAEALAVAAVLDAGLGNTDAAGARAEKLRGMKGFKAEAALASGVVASASGQAEQAVLALNEGIKALPPGPLRVHALMWLGRHSLALKNHARAAEVLKMLEKEAGPSAEAAELIAQAKEALGEAAEAKDERLRAYALDPYDAKRAAAAGRKVRPGGDGARTRVERVWRLLGMKAPKMAKPVLDEAEKLDPTNPYLAWARMIHQEALDKMLHIDEEPGHASGVAALDALKRSGKEPPTQVFPRHMRLTLVDVLDRTDRSASLEPLRRFQGDPDPRVSKSVTEAIKRGMARPRAKDVHSH